MQVLLEAAYGSMTVPTPCERPSILSVLMVIVWTVTAPALIQLDQHAWS